MLAHLFQQSTDEGEIPKERSFANICPLYKKGDRSLACIYRLVSLTCVPCRLLELMVFSNIMAHLNEHRLLSEKQLAFRKWHSCETQLITVIDDWATKVRLTPLYWTLKRPLTLSLINFSKANCLAMELEIDAFLCLSQQRVVVNGVKSDWVPVVSGVP